MDVIVPVGSRATVYVPAGQNQQVTESGKKVELANGVKEKGVEKGYKIFEVESGHYSFRST
jgi:alpha-L-rhamnosidase